MSRPGFQLWALEGESVTTPLCCPQPGHPAGRVAGDRGTARGILWRAFKRPPCSESIFVRLLGWLCPSLPLAPHIPAIAPLSQERAPIDLGTTPGIRGDLPWSAAMAAPKSRPRREETHGGCELGGGTSSGATCFRTVKSPPQQLQSMREGAGPHQCTIKQVLSNHN